MTVFVLPSRMNRYSASSFAASYPTGAYRTCKTSDYATNPSDWFAYGSGATTCLEPPGNDVTGCGGTIPRCGRYQGRCVHPVFHLDKPSRRSCCIDENGCLWPNPDQGGYLTDGCYEPDVGGPQFAVSSSEMTSLYSDPHFNNAFGGYSLPGGLDATPYTGGPHRQCGYCYGCRAQGRLQRETSIATYKWMTIRRTSAKNNGRNRYYVLWSHYHRLCYHYYNCRRHLS